MRGQPGTGHRAEIPTHVLVPQGRGESEYVGRYRGGPSPGAEIGPGRACTGLHQRAHEVEQRLLAFGQVGGTSRPVVHLDVDVVVIVNAPRPVHVVVPQALQVGGQIARTRAGYQQVTPVLEVECLQPVVRRPGAVTLQPPGRGQRLHLTETAGVQLQLAAAEQRLVVCHVAGQQSLVAPICSRLHPVAGGSFRLHAHVCFRIGEIRVEVHPVVRVGRYQEHHLIGLLHTYPSRLVGLHLAAFCQGPDTHHIFHPVVVQHRHIAQFPVFPGLETPGGKRIGLIGKHQVLHPRLVCRETNGQHIVRIRSEILTMVAHPLLHKINRHQGRVQRQGPHVTTDTGRVHSRGNAELSGRGETAEAGRILALCLVCHHAVEVVLCEACRLLPVALLEGTANFVQHMGRLFVHVPIVGSSLAGIGPATPQALFVECQPLLGHGAEDVGPQTAVAHRERGVFPLPIGVDHAVARRGGNRLPASPRGIGGGMTRFVEPNGLPTLLGRQASRPPEREQDQGCECLFECSHIILLLNQLVNDRCVPCPA